SVLCRCASHGRQPHGYVQLDQTLALSIKKPRRAAVVLIDKEQLISGLYLRAVAATDCATLTR
ncbi:MAG: hypothetical protein NT095_04125, partial [Burkholderiales bacterium]|nr:hypothetical protein [Burkholderiales bacterium]